MIFICWHFDFTCSYFPHVPICTHIILVHISVYSCAYVFFQNLVERERKTWSQAVQRDLPRPREVNNSILKGAPHRDQKFRDLYEVMLYMYMPVVCVCVWL